MDGTGITGRGFGRALVAAYGVLALAATARSAYQLGRHFDEAPFAYSLSAVAAVVYIVATVALALGGRRRGWRGVAWTAAAVEAVGVLTVGTHSLLDPAAYPDETVWSVYGQGYGYVPLVLPFAGLWWLWRTRPRSSPRLPDATEVSA